MVRHFLNHARIVVLVYWVHLVAWHGSNRRLNLLVERLDRLIVLAHVIRRQRYHTVTSIELLRIIVLLIHRLRSAQLELVFVHVLKVYLDKLPSRLLRLSRLALLVENALKLFHSVR